MRRKTLAKAELRTTSELSSAGARARIASEISFERWRRPGRQGQVGTTSPPGLASCRSRAVSARRIQNGLVSPLESSART
jgi:hypothetical protein